MVIQIYLNPGLEIIIQKFPKQKVWWLFMIIMWNVFLNSQDTILSAIQPAIQPATSISAKVIDDD